MKKLKYIKLYEQYRMNEEIFGLFGKKTEPKKVQTVAEVKPEDKISSDLMTALFPNDTKLSGYYNNSYISFNPKILFYCFVDYPSGKSPQKSFENINILLEQLDEQGSSQELRLKNLKRKLNDIDVSVVQKNPLAAAVNRVGDASYNSWFKQNTHSDFEEYLKRVDYLPDGFALNDETLFEKYPWYIGFNFEDFLDGGKFPIFSLHLKRLIQLFSFLEANNKLETMKKNLVSLKNLKIEKFDGESTYTQLTNLIAKLEEIGKLISRENAISDILDGLFQFFRYNKKIAMPYDSNFDSLWNN